jgi:hypothetical protein
MAVFFSAKGSGFNFFTDKKAVKNDLGHPLLICE